MKPKDKKARFAALSDLGCIICQCPTEIHHLLGLKYSGIAQKSKDEFTIPLCVNHHRGEEGIHHIGIKTWQYKYGTQEYLLELTNIHLGREFGAGL